jgi:hypothetical protein
MTPLLQHKLESLDNARKRSRLQPSPNEEVREEELDEADYGTSNQVSASIPCSPDGSVEHMSVEVDIGTLVKHLDDMHSYLLTRRGQPRIGGAKSDRRHQVNVEAWTLTLHCGVIHILMCCVEDNIADIARFKLTRNNYHLAETFVKNHQAIVSYLHQPVAHGFRGVDIDNVDDDYNCPNHEDYNDEPANSVDWMRTCMLDGGQCRLSACPHGRLREHDRHDGDP